jgi:hypothetical protein
MPPRRPAVVSATEIVVDTLKRRRLREQQRDERLSSWPSWRVRLNTLVREDPVFERCIFVLIVANCITISLENLVSDEHGVLPTLEASFTLIFLAEMLLRFVARGFFGQFGYFASNVNRFDFVLVIVSTYALLQQYAFPDFSWLPAFAVTAARSARLLRPLRTVNSLGSLRIILDSISSSAVRLVHLVLLALLFALTTGLVAMTFFRGDFRHRCEDPATNTTYKQVCAGPTEIGNVTFGSSAVNGFQCAFGQRCADLGNSVDGNTNFDYVYPTGITIFSMLMLEDWSRIMYSAIDSQGLLVQIYFLSLVLVGAFFLLNLVLATVADAFTSTLNALREDRKRLLGPEPAPASLSIWRLTFVTIVSHWIFQRAVMIFTVVNAALLAVVYHGMPSDAESALTIATVALAFIFLIETVLKLLAKPFGEFMSDPLNPFDALLSLGAIVEFFVAGTASVNALRSIRLLRLLEASKSMKRTLQVLSDALKSAAPLLLLLALVIFLFALLGMQLFAGSFCGMADSQYNAVNTSTCDNVPRLNFDNVGYAAVTTFAIIAGDGWRDVMTIAMEAKGEYAALYFVVCSLIGGLLMINLLMAVLIDATTNNPAVSETEQQRVDQVDDGTDNDAVVLFLVDHNAPPTYSPRSQEMQPLVAEMSLMSNTSQLQESFLAAGPSTSIAPLATSQPAHQHHPEEDFMLGKPEEVQKPRRRKKKDEFDTFDKLTDADIAEAVDDPLLAEKLTAEGLRQQESVEAQKAFIRRACRQIVNSRTFSVLIITTILFSVAAICVALPLSPPDAAANTFVLYSDIACAAVFVTEAILKIAWLGLYNRQPEVYGKGYLQHRWNVFDFVMTSATAVTGVLVLVGGQDALAVAKWLRLLRVIRPWSLVGRSRLTMLVFRSLITAMGAMTNLAIIASAVWLMYAILGTQAFRGMMYACTAVHWGDQTYKGLQTHDRDTCLTHNFTWTNNVRNFDNVGESMLTLFGVATTDMWTDVMFLTTDAVGHEEAPRANNRPALVLYCISFVVVVTFFLLNMTVSVLIDVYLQTRKLVEESLRKSLLHQGKITSLTHAQQDFVDMFRRALIYVKPPLRPPYSETSWRQQVRRLVRMRHYDSIYVVVALASVVIQATAFAEMPPIYDDVLLVVDGGFTIAFVVSMLANMVGYGVAEYMIESTSKLELFINLVTSAAIVARFAAGPNPIVDILRIFRVFRLQKAFAVSTGLRLFLDTLAASARTCVAVFLLVALLFFVYACVGMQLFSAVKRGEGITRYANFERIDFALITLLRVATFDDWQEVMWDCAQKPPMCDPDIGECGHPGWAQLYFFTFICLGQWVGINFFTAVLLDAFARSDREDRMAVQPKHVREFRMKWKEFSTSDKMDVARLPAFVKRLGAPIGSDDAERPKIVVSELNIMAVNNRVYQADVFDALLRYYYGSELPATANDTLNRLLANTFRRRMYVGSRGQSGWSVRMIMLVIRIQRAWRKYHIKKPVSVVVTQSRRAPVVTTNDNSERDGVIL